MGGPGPDRRVSVAEGVWMAHRSRSGRVQVWRLLVVWDEDQQALELFSHYGPSPGARPLRHDKGRQAPLRMTDEPAFMLERIRSAFAAMERRGYGPRRHASDPGCFDAGLDEALVRSWIARGRAHFAPEPRPGRAVRGLAEVFGGGRPRAELAFA